MKRFERIWIKKDIKTPIIYQDHRPPRTACNANLIQLAAQLPDEASKYCSLTGSRRLDRRVIAKALNDFFMGSLAPALAIDF